MNKKITALFLILLFNLIFAQFAGGTGTIEDPYQIGTPEQLNQVRYYLTSSFIQIADINLGVAPWNVGEGWDPIGDYDYSDPSKSFRGNYNGNNYKISNMYINRIGRSYQGLFGSTEGCDIRYIHLSMINVITDSSYLGGISGISYNDSILDCTIEGYIEGFSSIGLLTGFFEGYNIKNCHVKGEIKSTGGGWIGGMISNCNADSVINCFVEVNITSNLNMIGGFIAQNIDTSFIDNCGAEVNIIANGGYWIGGFIGSTNTVNRSMTISNSYTKGSVNVEMDSVSERTGGFIGSMSGYNPNLIDVINCFSIADVNGNNRVGGFIGKPYGLVNIESCYSAGQVKGIALVGGFIGSIDSLNNVSVTNCYWDTETSGIDSSVAGEGRTTAEMIYPYAANTYVGWDFSTVWRDDVINQNNGYPTFQWVSGIEDNEADFVAGEKDFELYQNYPNPFNPVTEIKYALAKAGNVNIKVFNTNGSEVADLVKSAQSAGVYSVSFDASKYSNGIFYYTLVVDNKIVATKKMILIK